jgi:hypothetical protein
VFALILPLCFNVFCSKQKAKAHHILYRSRSLMKQTFKVPMLFSFVSSRSFGCLGPHSSAAFSTLSASVASKLKDPSLVESSGRGTGETFNLFDPGASAQQFEDGSAVIAQVGRMGRDDTRIVSYS